MCTRRLCWVKPPGGLPRRGPLALVFWTLIPVGLSAVLMLGPPRPIRGREGSRSHLELVGASVLGMTPSTRGLRSLEARGSRGARPVSCDRGPVDVRRVRRREGRELVQRRCESRSVAPSQESRGVLSHPPE